MELAAGSSEAMILDLWRSSDSEKVFAWRRRFSFLGVPSGLIDLLLAQALGTVDDQEEFSRFLSFVGSDAGGSEG